MGPLASRLVRLFALLLLLPLSSRAQFAPDPEVGRIETDVEIVYYDLVGTTLQDLTASLDARGPRQGGQRYFGLTEWEVNAEYRWSEYETGCAMDDITVRVAIRTRLPRWRPRGPVHERTRHAWDRFVHRLDAHEDGHRTLAAEAGDAIRWNLVSLHEPTCHTMKRAAERTVAEMLNEYEARNRAYDHHTGHGRTQGAVWPPR